MRGEARTNAHATVGDPSCGNVGPPGDVLTAAADPLATGCTATRTQSSAQPGFGMPEPSRNPGSELLDGVRTDDEAQVLPTNLCAPVKIDQRSLKAGLRGPALLEDFILREEITSLEDEHIPEHIVHARRSTAHGAIDCYESQAMVTRASIFAEAGEQTNTFVRIARELHTELLRQGAVPRFPETAVDMVADGAGETLDVEATLETAPLVPYDAIDAFIAAIEKNRHLERETDPLAVRSSATSEHFVKTRQLPEFILLSIEHERSGIRIYETALGCVPDADLHTAVAVVPRTDAPARADLALTLCKLRPRRRARDPGADELERREPAAGAGDEAGARNGLSCGSRGHRLRVRNARRARGPLRLADARSLPGPIDEPVGAAS